MKIAQVSQHYLPVVGGQEVYIENLNRVFQEAGWENTIFQPDRGVRRADIEPVFRLRGVPKLVEGSEPHLFNFFLNLRTRPRLSAADVIISHYAVHAWPLRRWAQKVIVLSHGVEWQLENQNWDDRRRAHAARACLADFPHVVNDTHYLRTAGLDVPPAQGYFGEVAPRKWFIPNCVDTTRFQRTAGLPAWKGRRMVLVPRQVVRDRGIDLAIRAFATIAEKERDLEMLILGKMRPGPYLDLCFDLVKKLGLGKCVTFQDHIENGQMADYYSAATLTLIPTLRREGTSLSALESMACGTATVSTNVCGLADLPTVQSEPTDSAFAQAISETLAAQESNALRQCAAVREGFHIGLWADAWRKVVCTVAGMAS